MLSRILTVILISVQFSPLLVLGSGILDQRDAKERIFFGEEAKQSNFPFIVRLAIGDVLCAGTIIADRWVLTVAHCFHHQDCKKTKIFPSTWTPKSAPIAQGLECHIHEEFDNKKNRNDIGLIKTSKNLIQDGLSAIISLPDPGTHLPKGTNAVILGWGVTNNGMYPDHLIQGNVRIESWEICNLKQKHHLGECIDDSTCHGQNISVKVFCTQGEGALPPGVCTGDSGSPVIADGVLVGVTAYTLSTKDKCLPGSPSMHVSVVDYLPWIYSFIDPNRDTSQMKVLEDPK